MAKKTNVWRTVPHDKSSSSAILGFAASALAAVWLPVLLLDLSPRRVPLALSVALQSEYILLTE